MTRLRRVLTQVWICVLLLGMLSSNLENDPLDKVLEPWFGRPYAALGLRQYWAMFAPNPVHHGRFVRYTHIDPSGARTVLREPDQPPFPPGSQPWMGFGYSRQAKWDKQVGLKFERFAKPTAEALCRLGGLAGSVEITILIYATPTPKERLKGKEITRKETVSGPWACP